MINFQVECKNSTTIEITASGEVTETFNPPGNGWPYILTFEELLLDLSFVQSNFNYVGNFTNSDLNNSNSILVGYLNSGGVPPSMTDGSLRFTGILNSVSSQVTNLIVPGKFDNKITIIHPQMASILKAQGATGNVHFGPIASNIGPGIASQMVLGKWIMINSCESINCEKKVSIKRISDDVAIIKQITPAMVLANSGNNPNLRNWLLGFHDVIDGTPSSIHFSNNSLMIEPTTGANIPLWNNGYSVLELPNAMLKLAFYEHLPLYSKIIGSVTVTITNAKWNNIGKIGNIWWGLDNNDEWMENIGCYEIE